MVTVSKAQAVRFSNGGELSLSRLPRQDVWKKDGASVRVYDAENVFLGLGKVCLAREALMVLKLL